MPRSSTTWRSLTESRTSPGSPGDFSTWSRTSRPTIARASDASVAPSRGTVSIFLPRRRTVMRSAISSTSLSLWLMKMIDLPSACRLRMIPNSSPASCGVSTAVGSSRMRMSAPRKSAFRISTRCSGPDRDRAHERGRVDDEPELLRQLAHARLRPALVEEDLVARLHPEDDVLGHGHHRDEHEVLVHHPDPGLDRIAGRAEADRLPVQEDLAGVVLEEPVEDGHQRRLAGAVLAEQRVHLAPAQVEVDVVVGDDAARELLADSAHLEDEFLGHWEAIL